MVKVEIKNKNGLDSIIKIDAGKEISLRNYNWLNGKDNGFRRCHYDNIPGLDDDVIKKYEESVNYDSTPMLLDENGKPVRDEKGAEIYLTKEWLEGLEKMKNANRNLWAEVHSTEWSNTEHSMKRPGYLAVGWVNLSNGEELIAKEIEKNNEIWKKNLEFYKKQASYKTLLVKCKEDLENANKGKGDGNGDKDREKRNQEAAEVESLRHQAKEVINKALQEEPQVSNIELSDSSWEDMLWHATRGKERMVHRVIPPLNRNRHWT
jgi:hypothetical protein